MPNFDKQQVIEAVREIPRGRWVTYGDISEHFGVPGRHGGRAIANITIKLSWEFTPHGEGNVPTWRVFMADGIAPMIHEEDDEAVTGPAHDFWARMMEEEGLLGIDGRAKPELHWRPRVA
jgi:alkylated DNA nucleotide flippase Atl1